MARAPREGGQSSGGRSCVEVHVPGTPGKLAGVPAAPPLSADRAVVHAAPRHMAPRARSEGLWAPALLQEPISDRRLFPGPAKRGLGWSITVNAVPGTPPGFFFLHISHHAASSSSTLGSKLPRDCPLSVWEGRGPKDRSSESQPPAWGAWVNLRSDDGLSVALHSDSLSG